MKKCLSVAFVNGTVVAILLRTLTLPGTLNTAVLVVLDAILKKNSSLSLTRLLSIVSARSYVTKKRKL